jgi:hypothetical protein
MRLFTIVNLWLAIVFMLSACVEAKTQFIKQNNIEFMLADFAARDSISFPALIIPKARQLFAHTIIPLRVAIKNMTQQDVVFSHACITQADTEDLFEICKHSEVGDPAVIFVLSSWVVALLGLIDYTNFVRGNGYLGARIVDPCAVLPCLMTLWYALQAKQKNSRIKVALEARAEEVKIPAGGMYSTILFIDQVDLWQQPKLTVHDTQGNSIASCPLNLRLSFNFSTDINRYEYEGGL